MDNQKIEQAQTEIIEHYRNLRMEVIGNKFSRNAKVVKPSGKRKNRSNEA